jgi:hypothetical protein
MKIIPNGLSRKISEQGLLASENAPRVLLVAGVAGMIGSTVLACRATLKLEEVLENIENDKYTAHEVNRVVNSPSYSGDATYNEAELKRDLAAISIRGVGSLARLYAPSVLLGTVSVACLTKSHAILQDRNLALTAAYAAVDNAFARYRERVVDRYGSEIDRELQYDTERIDIVDEETGKVTSEDVITDAPGSAYARFYDEYSSRNWSPDPDINLLFLRNVQNYCNDRLRARGHLFLNEVFSELGLAHTKAGAIVGWRWNKESGDDYVDFGIWDGTQESVNDFFNGREGAILLDFNVDGVIYDKIEEHPS